MKRLLDRLRGAGRGVWAASRAGSRSPRQIVIAAVFLATAAVAVGVTGPRLLDDDSDDVVRPASVAPTPFPPGVIETAVRRANSCPSAASFIESVPRQLMMNIGPVFLYFAAETIDIDSRVRPDGWTERGYVLKFPLNIAGFPGTPVTIRAAERTSGVPAEYEGPGTGGVYVERASFALIVTPPPPTTLSFVPGAMRFPERGCYQVFIGVEGVEYGPFGLEVAG